MAALAVKAEEGGLCDDAAQAGASGVKAAQVILERLK